MPSLHPVFLFDSPIAPPEKGFIRIAGLDFSLCHVGMAKFDVPLVGNGKPKSVSIQQIDTEPGKNKSVRASADSLRRAREIREAVVDFLSDVTLAGAEVPHGSQSSSASKAQGIVIGLLAGLATPLVELNATEVKMAAVGSKTATKAEMIQWAAALCPEYKWRISPSGKNKGGLSDANEHEADAIATVWATIASAEFKRLRQTVAFMQKD